MRIHYDPEVDILLVQLVDEAKGPPAETREVADGVLLDMAEDGTPLALEVVNASRRYDRKDLRAVSMDEMVSLTEAGRPYGFSPDWLRRLAEHGRLRAQKVGRNWLTTAAWLEDYLESRRYNAKRISLHRE